MINECLGLPRRMFLIPLLVCIDLQNDIITTIGKILKALIGREISDYINLVICIDIKLYGCWIERV